MDAREAEFARYRFYATIFDEPNAQADCCIVGGGPAGMMAGLLYGPGRRLRPSYWKSTRDFLRDFRGDTIHPSTLEVMAELGLLESFLQRPHQEVTTLAGNLGDTLVTVADFTHLPDTLQVPRVHAAVGLSRLLGGRGDGTFRPSMCACGRVPTICCGRTAESPA